MMPPYSMICSSVPGSMWYFFRISTGMTIWPLASVFTTDMVFNLIGYMFNYLQLLYNQPQSLSTGIVILHFPRRAQAFFSSPCPPRRGLIIRLSSRSGSSSRPQTQGLCQIVGELVEG